VLKTPFFVNNDSELGLSVTGITSCLPTSDRNARYSLQTAWINARSCFANWRRFRPKIATTANCEQYCPSEELSARLL
jgi:hypothetical protein